MSLKVACNLKATDSFSSRERFPKAMFLEIVFRHGSGPSGAGQSKVI
jgi:hypothetical protein